MKKNFLFISFLAMIVMLSGCSALRVASTTENDSVYFTSNDRVQYVSNYEGEDENRSQAYTNRDEEDDFYYSRRLNRFNSNPGSNFGYYSPFFSDSYFMYGSPYGGFYNNMGMGGYYNPWYGNTGVWGNYYNPWGGFGGYGGFYNPYNPWCTWGGGGFGGFYNPYNPWGYGGGFYNPYNPWGYGSAPIVMGNSSLSMPHRGSTSPMVNPQAAFNTPRPVLGRSSTSDNLNSNPRTFGGKNEGNVTPRVYTPSNTPGRPNTGVKTPRVNNNTPSPRPTPTPRSFESPRPSGGSFNSGGGGGGRSSSGSGGGGHRPR